MSSPSSSRATEFEQQLADKTKAEYPDAQADLDSRLLGLLGAVPKGTDMKALQAELMAGQVAGYYDPDSGELVVRTPDGSSSLDANGQITLAHELDHALTDQVLGLPDTAKPGESDADLAQLGLVEGDATLLMEQFSLGSVSLLDQLGAAMSPDAAAAQQQLDGAPSYLRNQLMFPYLSGLSYVCRLYVQGGWPAVDAAYRDLPQTTAELLYPDRAGVAPKDPGAIASPGGGWTEAQEDTLGAAQLLWLFQAPGGDEGKAITDAAQAAQRWAGGDLALFTSGEKSALGVALVDTDGRRRPVPSGGGLVRGGVLGDVDRAGRRHGDDRRRPGRRPALLWPRGAPRHRPGRVVSCHARPSRGRVEHGATGPSGPP